MIGIPEPNSTSGIADWIELYIIREQDILSRASLRHIIERESGEEQPEPFISDIWREMKGRYMRYNPPPFEVFDQVIASRDNYPTKVPYLACLLLSIFGAQTDGHDPTKLFEHIACASVKSYINGNALRFGWPARGGGGAIGKRVANVAFEMKEMFIQGPANKYKDRGVDIIAWIPFDDDRSNQISILLSCAAGKNWRTKTMGLPLDAWKEYIHWACEPQKAFAVPCIISDSEWHDKSKEAGLLFDRIRIINFLCMDDLDGAVVAQIEAWIEAAIAELDEANE